MALLAQSAAHAIAVLWNAILHAGLAWLLVAPLAVYSIYKLLTPVFARAARKSAKTGVNSDSCGPAADLLPQVVAFLTANRYPGGGKRFRATGAPEAP